MDSSREIATYTQHFRRKDDLLKGLHAETEKADQAREKLAAHQAKLSAGTRANVGYRNDPVVRSWGPRLARAERRIAEYKAELQHLNDHPPNPED